MKSTIHFKNTIQAYLEERAASDTQFEWVYTKEGKSIDKCIQFILHTVQKSGCNGFADEEIFNIAEEYYTKDTIEIGNPMNAQVSVNHVVILTKEEIEQARKEALERAQDEAYRKMTQPVKKAKKVVLNAQTSLFDF